MGKSREGWHWTATEGLQPGLETQAVVEPPQKVDASVDVYDAIVIGAGYTGLTATRDLTTSGIKTLLLEGRDRIGGRTWSSDVDGYPYEMGGTWVHWFQPHVYRELSRYNMADQLKHSTDYTKKHNFFTFVSSEGTKTMSHEDEDKLFARAMEKFVNVDGQLGRVVMPFPNNQYWNKDVLKYAELSVADRLAQLGDTLSSDERDAIRGFVLLCSGGTADNSAFLDFLRWWAAGNFDYKTLLETIIIFKLKCGQSGFARRFFHEALNTNNLSYSFDIAVTRVDSSSSSLVQVHTAGGNTYRAKRVVCTVPLNVLDQVEFVPPLEKGKVEAAALKHVNQCVKVHAEIQDPEMRSWAGVSPNGKLVIGVADGTTPAGKTHCVFFGCDDNHFHAEDSIEETIKAVNGFIPMDVDRVVFHNWSRDKFAKGAWVWYQPGMEVKYLEALRKRHGPVLFANSDWAAGAWRSFIDGAIQSGTEAAMIVRDELKGGQPELNGVH